MQASAALVLTAAVALAACAPLAATPPARMLPSEAAVAPPLHHADYELGAAISSVGDSHSHHIGAARVRQSVTDHVTVEAEGAAFSTTQLDSISYAGRAGLHLSNRGATDQPHLALTAGAGAGTSSVGNWWGVDAGGSVMRRGSVRPYLGASLYVSQPFATRPFEVQEDEAFSGSVTRELELTHTYGAYSTFGVEVGDDQIAFDLGLSYGAVVVDDNPRRPAGGISVGVRITP